MSSGLYILSQIRPINPADIRMNTQQQEEVKAASQRIKLLLLASVLL